MKWIANQDYPWLVVCSKCGYSLSYGKDVCPGCGEKHEPNQVLVSKEISRPDGTKIVRTVTAGEAPGCFSLVCKCAVSGSNTDMVEMTLTYEELRTFANGILSVLKNAEQPR